MLYLWNRILGDFVSDSIVDPYVGGDQNYPMPLFLVDLDGDGLSDIVRGYDPTVSDDPTEQPWTWYKWGFRLNDHQGWFGPTQFIADGHALGGNHPPFTGFSASDSTGRNALFAMSTKVQNCTVTQSPSDCHWKTEDGEACFNGQPGCGWVCYGYETNYYTWPTGKDFGIDLSGVLDVGFDQVNEDHTLRSLADVNGDGIDDVVTFKADTNDVCVRAWGTGGELHWLDPPPCVKVDTGRDPEPAVYYDDTGSDTHCGYKEMGQPAPWRLRIWDVDGDGRHDVVVQHLQKDPDYPDDEIYIPDGEVYRAFLDATGALKSGAFPEGNAGPYKDIGSLVGDFDGDGRLDLLAFDHEPFGKLLLQKKSTADLLTGVVDGSAANDAERVEYSTTWRAPVSTWPRDVSRYPLYVDGPNLLGPNLDPLTDLLTDLLPGGYPVKKMHRGLNVVRKHDVYQGDDIGQYVHHEYAYADPTFDLRGRGFLGFRVVDHYMPDVPSEQVTFYDNFHNDYDPATNQGGVYLGVMRPVDVIQMTFLEQSAALLPRPARVSRLTTKYKRSPGLVDRSYFVHPDTWRYHEWEQELSSAVPGGMPRMYDANGDVWAFGGSAPIETHATSPVKTVLGEATYDALGNLTQEEVVNPQGVYRVKQASYFAPNWNRWRLAQKKTEDVAVGSLGFPVEPRHVELEYDDGLVSKVYVEKNHPDTAIPSTLTIDRNDDGSVTRITRSAADVVDRFETFEYGDAERMFVTRTENALGHATRALTHPALGVVVASRDPNGVLTTRQINDRGMVTRIQRAGVAAVMERLFPSKRYQVAA